MRWAAKALAGLSGAFTLAILGATPASAHPIDYLHWGDNHTLCTNCSVNKGDVFGFWQSIIVADHWSSTTGRAAGYCNIDGYFGANTRSFTKSWQSHLGLSVDGIVGKHTWKEADNFIHKRYAGNTRDYYYRGRKWNEFFQVLRNKNGRLIWQPQYPYTLPYYNSSHPGISFPRGEYC